jgi:hypothetical protein
MAASVRAATPQHFGGRVGSPRDRRATGSAPVLTSWCGRWRRSWHSGITSTSPGRKIAAELPWLTGTRTASTKTGGEAGFAAFGGKLSLSHVTEPVTESEATLVHWVDELEDHWRRTDVVFPPMSEAIDGNIFYVQGHLRRGGSPSWPGVWWSGVIDRIAIVLTGSSVHLMGPTRASEDKDLWMSELEEQWNTLVGQPGNWSHGEEWAIGCAMQFATGSGGGAPPQFVEACVLTNTVLDPGPDRDADRLVLGSPYFVALLH